ncbi:Hsp20/alpha crystallin family protein [Actinoplanes sp. NPDC026619]|uniref:Hsp20/alpha crystallin family protein n=1 Tax=Actinoplanes sp. NPDC026619 TaxID=3155798 RepID=UPI0033FD50D1
MLLHSATVHDLDRITARVFDTTRSGCRLNAYRIDGTFHIDIDLPGIDPAGIDITADDKVLTVRAERKQAPGESAEPQGAPVSRQVLLSDRLDTDRLDAHYANGVLTLSIPVSVSAGTGTN